MRMPPPDLDLYQCCVKILDDACATKLNKTVAFLDDAFAEVLHWHGGAATLFNVGVLDIREFSSFESAESAQKRASFFISTPIIDETSSIFRDIVMSSWFEHVVVFTSICPTMHSIIECQSADDEMKAFNIYRNQILDWMGTKVDMRVCMVEIFYVPLVAAPILPSLFVLPSNGGVFPLLPTDLHYLKHRQRGGDRSAPWEAEFVHLPRELQLKLKLLVCSLNSLLEVLSCSEDVFALGPTSCIVASELAGLTWTKNRKKTAQHKASLLIVDRTLDMASAVGHFQDSMLDKILATLARLPAHQNDVAVNMEPVCAVTSNAGFCVVAPGSLAHPDDPAATGLLNTLSVLKHKEAMMEMNRQLVEALTRESLLPRPPDHITRVTLERIESQLELFKGRSASVRKHSGLLQLVLAAVQTQRDPRYGKLDSLLGVEKGLMQSLGDDDSPSVISQLTQTLQRELKLPANERSHAIDDFLLLTSFVYSLFSDAQSIDLEEEITFKDLLIDAVMADADYNGILSEIAEYSRSEEQIGEVLDRLFDKLRGLSNARDGFKDFRSIYEPGSISSQAKLVPLLRQVIEGVLDPARPDLPDITHKSIRFGDLLKSGFGLFRSVSKPRPGDHPLLIVFVIGGVTCTEIRQIRDTVSTSKSKVQVLVGSTRLVSHEQVLRQMLVQDNLCQPN